MALVDYGSSSESSSNSSDEEENIKYPAVVKTNTQPQLPSANDLLSGTKSGEVFNNPYKEAENAKLASLEKHVKMVDTDEKTRVKNGKKICWNYRKGRCRFGSKCTFAHDSDLHSIEGNVVADDKVAETKMTSVNVQSMSMPQLKKNGTPAVSQNQNAAGRKRPGLSNTIIPSKKVIKQYNMQRK